MKKRGIALALAVVLVLGLGGCKTKDATVPVVSVGMLTGAGTAAEKYAGEVVSEQVTQIQRDTTLEIEKLYVQEGDQVKAGDVLFTYNVDLLELDLERAKLELEQMQAAVSTYTTQIKELQTKIKSTKDATEKMGYEIRLQELEVDKDTKEYEIAAKQKEIQHAQSALKEEKVTAPVAGRIRSVNESGYDEYGNAAAYITIQQSGAYRIKAAVNELNLLTEDCGVTLGAKARIISRVDSTQVWTGTVTQIDTETSESTADTAATSYPFYVDLEDTTGLILGQHVYVEIITNVEREGIWMPEGYLMDVTTSAAAASTDSTDSTDGTTGDTITTAWVWAADEEGCLQRRTVQLGAYDETLGAYEILSGLTAEDYVADPANSKCAEGVYVEYRSAADFTEPPATQSTDGTDGTGGTEISDAAETTGEPDAQPSTAATEPKQNTNTGNSGNSGTVTSSSGDLEVVPPYTEAKSNNEYTSATGMPGEKDANGDEMSAAQWGERL